MILRLQWVTPMVSHQLTRPEDLGVTPWPKPPHQRGTTVPSPSMSTMKRPTLTCPTMGSGRVIWPVGDTEDARALAVTPSSLACQQVAVQQEPASRVRGLLTEGFDSTVKRLRTLCPGVRLGYCLRHALTKLPKPLAAMASPVRKALRLQCHTR
jgi:hypothetical protein